ncbi:hypothetical protein CBR_g30211 [Chara braunii]|uniref:Uncharacterized protein n=1 Tax=Chara braunii TaxID=69332 RepID=A0A388LCA9_CHABU|nr:hypothetical protein CBR_g30211 [Chara braunii]|eukprot:GBG79949.1 hypothetical protein CBR_g30211 [Chara braunii]
MPYQNRRPGGCGMGQKSDAETCEACPLRARAEAAREVAALLRGTAGATAEMGTALGCTVRGGGGVARALGLGGGGGVETGSHPLVVPGGLPLRLQTDDDDDDDDDDDGEVGNDDDDDADDADADDDDDEDEDDAQRPCRLMSTEQDTGALPRRSARIAVRAHPAVPPRPKKLSRRTTPAASSTALTVHDATGDHPTYPVRGANEPAADYRGRLLAFTEVVAAVEARKEAAEAERQRLANEAAAEAQRTAETDAATRDRRNASSTESLIACEHQWTTILQGMIFVPTEAQADSTPAEAERNNLANLMLDMMREATQQQQQHQLLNSTITRVNSIEANASAAPGCTTNVTKQLNERIDHVVTIIGDISTFTGPDSINSTVAAIKTDLTKLQTRPEAATKTFKMPHFDISKFDDYNKSDALSWWQRFLTEASCRMVPADDMLKALYLQLIGGAQGWMNHLAATHKCTIAELYTHITWKEFEQLWFTRFMVRNVVKAAMNEAILDRANLVIQTDDKAANERQSQPHYVAKQTYQRPAHNNAVFSEEIDDHHATAASLSDGGIVAALPPKHPKRVRKNKATQGTAATGAGQQPWTAYKITKDVYDLRQKYAYCLWCNKAIQRCKGGNVSCARSACGYISTRDKMYKPFDCVEDTLVAAADCCQKAPLSQSQPNNVRPILLNFNEAYMRYPEVLGNRAAAKAMAHLHEQTCIQLALRNILKEVVKTVDDYVLTGWISFASYAGTFYSHPGLIVIEVECRGHNGAKVGPS